MISRWLAYAASCAALVVFALGCSSGGGGVTFIEVLQVSPEDGRTDVQVETRIGFRIDTLIDPAALNGDTFIVADSFGNQVDGELAIDEEDGTVAALTPTEPLSVITDYTATITTEMLNTAGNGLEEDFTWSFMTLDSEWGTSEWVETTGLGSSSSQAVGVDANANAFSVWEFNTGQTGELNQIWANRYTRVELWDSPQQIDADNGDAQNPALAVSAGGNAFAVWEDWARVNGNPEATIWTNRYTLDQGWGTAEQLQDGVLPSLRPAVAADPDGNAIAVWVQLEFPSNNQVMRARRYDASSGWGEIVAIDLEPTSGTPPEDISVDMDADGNAIAIWTDRRIEGDGVEQTRGGRVWANRYVAGQGWQTARLIKPDGTTRADTARLSVGAGGEAQVVWVQFRQTTQPISESRRDIWGARYEPGSDWDTTDWSDPGAVSDAEGAGFLDKVTPDVAVDGAGIAHAVWSQKERDDGGSFNDIYASRNEGSGWDAAVLVEPPNPDPREDGDATQPRVGVNAAGNTFVVWRQLWEDWGSIWSNRIDPGEAWVPDNTELIEAIDRPGQRPLIAVDDRRHAHAVWIHAVDTVTDRIRTNRFE